MWMSAMLPVLLGLVIVFVPGLLVVLALRVKGFDAIALAPPVSVAMVSISAIVAPMLGISWGIWVPFAFALLIAALGFAVTFFLQKAGLEDGPSRRILGTTIERTPMTWGVKRQMWFYLAVALGALMSMRNLARSIGDANWISQTWDNVFHLNAVRYIVDTGNGSSLNIASMTSGGNPPTFYPTAWHDIVSLVFMHSGASIPVATNATVLVVAGLVWPLSVIYMIRSIFPVGRFALLLAGAASASMISFPFSLVYFGVLYPNLLGYSLLPVGIGMMAQLFRVGLVRYLTTTQSAFLGVFAALGIAIAHPNAIMSLLVLVMPTFATRIILQIIAAIKRETPWWTALLQTVGISLIFVVISILWGVVRPPKEAGEMWDPTTTQGQAIGEMLTNEALKTQHPLWLVTALSLIGIYFLVICKNRLYWIFGTWGVLAYYYIAVRSLNWEDGRYDVVGIWYHDSFRLAALVPTVVLLFIAYGAHQVALKATGWTSSLDFSRIGRSAKDRSVALITVAVATLVALTLVMQSATPLNNYIKRSRALYEPTLESDLLTPDEFNVLDHLDEYVPEDAEIVVSAFNGGPLAYALADRKVTAYHTLATVTEDDWYIYDNLDKAGKDPKVCQLLEKDNIKYWLWFGWKEVNNDGDHAMWYKSFEKLFKTQGVIEPVYQSGGATLYKITACD